MTVTTVTNSPWWGSLVVNGGFSVGGALLGGLATQLYHVWNGNRDHVAAQLREQDKVARKSIVKFMTAMNNDFTAMTKGELPAAISVITSASEMQITCPSVIAVAGRDWHKAWVQARNQLRGKQKITQEHVDAFSAGRRNFLIIVRKEFDLDDVPAGDTDA